MYTSLRYLTYLTYLGRYLRFSLYVRQVKSRQVISTLDKKGYQILSLKSLCQIIYTGQVYIDIHLTPNTSLSYSLSFTHTLSLLYPFWDVKG